MFKIAGYGQALFRGLPFDAFTRDIWLICLSNVIGAFGEGLYFWVFPIYIESLQADYVQIGLIFSVLYGASALMPLMGGMLADKYNRKTILLAAWTPWFLSPLIYSFATGWQQLVPGAICWGVSMIGVPAANAYIITAVKDKGKLASVLAIVWGSYSFSYIFAPSIGGFLETFVGMRWVLRVSAVLTAVATGVFLFLHSQHPKRDADGRLQQTVVSAEKGNLWRSLLTWSAFFAFVSFFTGVGRTFVPTFLKNQVGLSELYVGLFGSVSFAGITFIGLAMGRLGDKWPKSRAISLCLLSFMASMSFMYVVRETTGLMVMAFFYGGSVAIGTLVSSYVGSIAPERKRGLWLSIPQTFSLAAAFIAPYVAGYMYTLDPFYVFAVSIGAIPFLIVVALTTLRE